MGARPVYTGITFFLIASIMRDVFKHRNPSVVEGLNLNQTHSSRVEQRNKRSTSTYNTKLLPQSNTSAPVLIDTDVFVDDVNSFNALDMDFRLDFFLWQRWSISQTVCDHYVDLLENPYFSAEEQPELLVPQKVIKLLWVPDTYITNAKTASTPSNIPSTKYMKIIILDDHCEVVYTIRLAGKMACQMEFKDYPLDIQSCPITFRSFSHSNTEMTYKWNDIKQPTLNPEILMLQHTLQMSKTEVTKEIFNSGVAHFEGLTLKFENILKFLLVQILNYSILIIQCKFIRKLDYYLIQVYTPSTLIVILSWFNFWLGLDIMAGRISLSVTSLLALVTQFANVRKDLPQVSYVNGIDVWMVTCIGFVIGSLLEFTFVRFINNSKNSEEEKVKPKTSKFKNRKKKSSLEDNLIYRARKFLCSKGLDVAVDNLSRLLFPGAFIIFNVIYWPLLFNREL